jgi:hypothetical protein
MWRPLILNKLNKSASRWFHYADILWCTVSKTLSLYIKSKHILGSIYFFSPENRAVYDNVEKCGAARDGTDDEIMRRLRITS